MGLNRFLLFITLFFFQFTYSQQVNWIGFEEAFELQKKVPKPIIVDVYTVWCGPCKLLDRYTFSNKDVAEYLNEYYYAVKFNAEGNEKIKFMDREFINPGYDSKRSRSRNSTHYLTRYLGVSGYPTMVLFDSDGNYITPITGVLNPMQIEIYLKLIEKKDFKKINSSEDFSDYIENFEFNFKS